MLLNRGFNCHREYLVRPSYWTSAQSQARNLGGHLAAINAAAENAWIRETFGNYGSVSRTLMTSYVVVPPTLLYPIHIGLSFRKNTFDVRRARRKLHK
jgi:hypothetical protein